MRFWLLIIWSLCSRECCSYHKEKSLEELLEGLEISWLIFPHETAWVPQGRGLQHRWSVLSHKSNVFYRRHSCSTLQEAGGGNSYWLCSGLLRVPLNTQLSMTTNFVPQTLSNISCSGDVSYTDHRQQSLPFHVTGFKNTWVLHPDPDSIVELAAQAPSFLSQDLFSFLIPQLPWDTTLHFPDIENNHFLVINEGLSHVCLISPACCSVPSMTFFASS